MNDQTLISKPWWWSNRLKYNEGQIIAGFVTFMLYRILGEIIIAPREEFEETIFEMAFQRTGYLMMTIIANAFYTLGWLIDILLNKSNSQLFRECLSNLGYWFYFALPILIILSAMARFLILFATIRISIEIIHNTILVFGINMFNLAFIKTIYHE